MVGWMSEDCDGDWEHVIGSAVWHVSVYVAVFVWALTWHFRYQTPG